MDRLVSGHKEVLSMRSFTVVCQFDGKDQWDMGADEVVVSADSPAEALAKARKKWRLTYGAQWPHLRLVKAEVLTKNLLQKHL